MNLFFDVDALHKLAAYDALPSVLSLFNATLDTTWVLGTARFKLRLTKRPDAIKRNGVELADRLIAFTTAAKRLTGLLTVSELSALEGVHDIDQGEMTLFALAARTPEGIILTGDKRALRALASEPRCATYVQLLERRVACLEQVLEALMIQQGFLWLHQRVSRSPGVDSGIARIVAPSATATEENALEGFRSTINDLRRNTASLLVPHILKSKE